MLTGITTTNVSPSAGLDAATETSLRTARTIDLVDAPNPEALTCKDKPADFIARFGNNRAKGELEAIQKSNLPQADKDAAIANLAQDVKAGHVMKGRIQHVPGFEKGAESGAAYAPAIANRLPSHPNVTVPDFANMLPEKREAAFKEYLGNLVAEGALTQPQADDIMVMVDFDAAVVRGGTKADVIGDIGKAITGNARVDSSDPTISKDQKELTASFGDHDLVARTNADGKKEVQLTNTRTGEVTTIDASDLPDGTHVFELDGGGELRVDVKGGDITGLAVNGDGKRGDDYSVAWDAQGKFCKPPEAISNWGALPPGVANLREASGKQSSAETAWTPQPAKTEPKTEPASTPPKTTPTPTATKFAGADNLFALDFDGDGKAELLGIDSDKDGKPDLFFPVPSQPATTAP